MLLFRRPPHGTVYAAEGYRMAEALAAFEIPMRMVFAEDGVLVLLKGQGGGKLNLGDIGAAFARLASTDSKELIVVKEDLAERGLLGSDLVEAPIRAMGIAELGAMMDECKVVLPF